jgi:hypothetical protein
MRLFNVAAISIVLMLAIPASASEHKRMANKHVDFSGVFASSAKETVFKFEDLSDDETAISHDSSSHTSFQAEKEFRPAWFDYNKRVSHGGEHVMKGNHFSEGYGHHKGRWDREPHGGNGHQGGHDWDEDDGHHGGHGDHEWDDDDDFTQPVPEPETYAMMLAGLFAIGALKRRKA